MYICIAGKNECAVNALKYLLLRKFKKSNILVLPNNNDKGADSWQPSLKKFAKKNNIKITKIEELYRIKELFFFSLEYINLIKINKFKNILYIIIIQKGEYNGFR